MRRIYYAYVLRMVTRGGVWQSVVMMLSMILLTRFVSLGNVLNNFMHVEVSRIGAFTYNALSTTEMGTIALMGVFLFSLLSFRMSVVPRRHGYQKQIA